jgi:hypothetical protein
MPTRLCAPAPVGSVAATRPEARALGREFVGVDMPGVMPYVMEKGPYFSVVESRLADPADRRRLLTDLKGGVALSSICGFDSTTLDLSDPPNGPHDAQEKARVEHLDHDWFGMEPDANGDWQYKTPKGAEPTGFWHGYQGNPEKILRAAMIGAIEVSLGLPPGGQPANAKREWPIDFYWVCQGPWFQCWVLWRETAHDGHVTVTITTPATTGHPLTTKITRANAKPGSGYKSPPLADAYKEARGMWVFGHEDYDKKPHLSTRPTRFLKIPMPEMVWCALSHDVVCVSPAEWEGGVLPAGRRYSPAVPAIP